MGNVNNMPKPTDKITLSAWVNPSTSNNTQSIIESYEGGGAGLFLNAAATQASFQLYSNGGYRATSTTISPNIWTHIVGTYDKSNLKIYFC